MTPGKAGGLLGERLKGASNTVSRLKTADFFSFPLDGGRLGWGETLRSVHTVDAAPPPSPSPFQGREIYL